MNKFRVFFYETLKQRATREKAIGHDLEFETKARLPSFHEEIVTRHDGKWPTILRYMGDYVDGEIFRLSATELKKLDDWEDHYHRVPVMTNQGSAFCYVLS